MARSVQDIEREVLSLSAEDKATLLRTLITSLDTERDESVDDAWHREAQRRHQELKRGQAKATPAEEVFERARSQLNK